MLILSRKRYEEIRIGDSVTIRVARIGNDRVSLGIDAPKDVAIVRGELETNQGSESCPSETETENTSATSPSTLAE